jgi:hypothetical protein
MTKKYSIEEANNLLLNWTAFAPDFDQWDLANEAGWTIAHTAAKFGYLPADFSQWSMADNKGFTVAHHAAILGDLPVNFNQWGLVTKENESVLRSLLSRKYCIKFMEKWMTEKPLCRTIGDWEVFKAELPEIYQKYTISDHMLNADNDHGALQRAFL